MTAEPQWALLDDLHVGVLGLDADGVVTYVNRRLAEMLGSPAAELIGQPVLGRLHPDDRDLVIAQLQRRRDSRPGDYDVRLIGGDGGVLAARVMAGPLHRDGRYAGSLGVVVDRTADAAREQELAGRLHDVERDNDTKTRVLSWASHELRTPLAAIAGYAQLLHDSVAEPAQREMASSILAATEHVLDLVQNLLDVSKADADALAPRLETVRLCDAVDDAVELVAATAAEHDVHIDVLHCTNEVVADRRHLVQAIVNLLSNAVKYGGDGSTVRVACASDGGRVRCSISDEGPGVPVKEQRRIFRPFERLGDDGSDGVGLGLSIADALVRAMNGSITLDAQGGATFVIELPAATPTSTAAADDPPNRLVLYVEDEPLNASLMESIIAMIPGRSLHIEATIVGGLAALRERRPALVLLDLNLADGSGLDVLTAIRDDPSLAVAPVWVLSADATEQTASRARALGADRFITKPFDIKEFVSVVESVT